MSEPPPIPATLEPVARERVEALDSRACPSCGGKAEWSPRQQSLVCPYCGTPLHGDNAAADEAEVIKEHDLHLTLRTLEEASRGFEKGQRKVHCQHCNADSLVPSDRVADRCQFCGSPSIVAYDAIESAIKPESVLPKQVTKDRAYTTLKKYLGSRFWAPGDLKRKNLVDQIKGVYLPYWTFDAAARCPWTAESGTYYWDTERYTDAHGKRRTRRVRKTRWRPASGEVSTRFDDVLVSATALVPADELKAIEPFPTGELVSYETAYVAGWQVEHYQGSLLDGAKRGRALMQAVLRNLAGSDVPGDTYRNLRIYPEYSHETFKHILVPAWLLLYDYRGKLYRSIVNGYTGTVTGAYPKSAWKIFFAVLLGILAVGVLLLVFATR